MGSSIRLNLFGIADLLREGWIFFKLNFKNILIVTLLVYIPINIIVAIIPVDYLTDEFGFDGYRIFLQIIRFLQTFIGIIATLSIAKIIESSIDDITIPWTEAIKHGLSKWASAIGTSILGGLIILGFTMLLIIPGLIYKQYYCFVVLVVALRGISGKKALDYSKSLVQGQWWRIFGIQLVLGLLALIIIAVVSLPLNLIIENEILGIIPNTLIDIVSAFFTVISVLLFLNNDYVYKPAAGNEAALPVGKENPDSGQENYLNE